MAKPTRYQIAKEVAAATDELFKEGLLDEWGAGFGHHLAQNILDRGKAKGKPRQNDAPKVEAAE